MKTAIFYHSYHHGNTKKLVDAIVAAHNDITVFEAESCHPEDLSSYDLIGLASGIYYFSFHPSILNIAAKLPLHQHVFLLSTYGGNKLGMNYARKLEAVLSSRQAEIVGRFSCLGYNTYGFFKLFGGTGKGHPDDRDIRHAIAFYESLNA
ncbi:MAG: flavodoxin [Lentisphaeria bacterium]|nr:flavodoxin [Lentisphaeria bacterium]